MRITRMTSDDIQLHNLTKVNYAIGIRKLGLHC
jgi:hypothetical protein